MATCPSHQFTCTEEPANSTQTSLQAGNKEDTKKAPKVKGGPICLPMRRVCDGQRDCPSGEDEKRCPVKKECKKGSRCNQVCITTADGKDGCACNPGYKLAPNGYSCLDIDECSPPPDDDEEVLSEWLGCSQVCHNSMGSFSCSCADGYVLRPDGRSCKALGPPPLLLFANRVDIRQVSLNNIKYTAILKGLQNAIALDYHHEQGLLFWSDVSLDVIKRANINGTGTVDVIRWGLESPGGVAVDWIHGLLFWTDSGARRVEVSTLDGGVRYVVAASDLDKPRAIALHPGQALLFWTDWGPNPKIERAEMDGSNRQSIIKESVFWPNGLTVDYTVDRIYWADAKHHVIESAGFDGSGRRKIISKSLPHPFAITIFEDAIYWTDWHTKSISMANKVTGSGFKTVHSRLHFPMGIQSYHPQRQPTYTNRCGNNSGGCSHLCLPNRLSYKCVCPETLRLLPDGHTCDKNPNRLLLFARSKDLRLIKLDKDGNKEKSGVVGGPIVDRVLPIDGIHSAVAIAWHAPSDTIFWTDVEDDVIGSASLHGHDQRIVISTNLVSPAGLAVDWITNKLYWTDAGTNRIEVSNLDGTMRSLLIWEGLDKPRDIVVDPIGGLMYWSDWGSVPKIESAGMDGSLRMAVVTKNLTWPNGLAIDHERGLLYWVDGGTKSLEYIALNGTKRVTLIAGELPHPFGLSIFENKVYWTDWDTFSIHSADKFTGRNRTVIKSGITGLMDLRVFHRGRQQVPSLCNSNNGGCSHLCLLAPMPLGHTCACPTGIKLMALKLTLISEGLGLPNSLTVDRASRRLYWNDRNLKTIESCELLIGRMSEGMNKGCIRKVIIKEKDPHPYGMIVVGNYVYWMDKDKSEIHRTDKNNGNNHQVTADSLEDFIKDHPEPEDARTCALGPTNYLLHARRVEIRQLSLDVPYMIDVVLPFPPLKNAVAADVDQKTGEIYWTDTAEDVIMRATRDGSRIENIIVDGLETADGIAIDSIGRKLYWTDAGRNSIEVAELDGRNRKVLVWSGLESPQSITLYYDQGLMFWADWGEVARIEQSDMDGKNRGIDMENMSQTHVLVSANLTTPDGLAVDWIANNIYWTDTGRKVLEVARLDGSSRKIVIGQDLDEPRSIALYPKKGFHTWITYVRATMEVAHISVYAVQE
ncbi:hypothetical protein J437_LFUL007508, partial [Ladona fulva]